MICRYFEYLYVCIFSLYKYLGTLSVTVDGPAKVSLDCTETDDGYKARWAFIIYKNWKSWCL